METEIQIKSESIDDNSPKNNLDSLLLPNEKRDLKRKCKKSRLKQESKVWTAPRRQGLRNGNECSSSDCIKTLFEEKPYICDVCGKGFKTKANLNNHVYSHAKIKPRSCKDCDATFATSGELLRHVRYQHTQEKPHHCTQCDYASVELCKLKRHMRRHTSEPECPYTCPLCTYASAEKSKLKRHLITHTGEKPYKCDICQAQFTQSNSVKVHKRNLHAINKSVFSCDFCPSTCSREHDLRVHIKKLHGNKVQKCKFCAETFPDKYSYKLHLKTHKGENCFKCEFCSYACRQEQFLQKHKILFHRLSNVASLKKGISKKDSKCEELTMEPNLDDTADDIDLLVPIHSSGSKIVLNGKSKKLKELENKKSDIEQTKLAVETRKGKRKRQRKSNV